MKTLFTEFTSAALEDGDDLPEEDDEVAAEEWDWYTEEDIEQEDFDPDTAHKAV